MITRYVGVFCAERKCHHFIVLSSQEASNPSIFGSDIDPTTSGKGIPCPKCGLTCHCCFLDKSERGGYVPGHHGHPPVVPRPGVRGRGADPLPVPDHEAGWRGR